MSIKTNNFVRGEIVDEADMKNTVLSFKCMTWGKNWWHCLEMEEQKHMWVNWGRSLLAKPWSASAPTSKHAAWPTPPNYPVQILLCMWILVTFSLTVCVVGPGLPRGLIEFITPFHTGPSSTGLKFLGYKSQIANAFKVTATCIYNCL